MKLQELWYAAPPVPTASGVAHSLGWLDEAFATDGIKVRLLQNDKQNWWRNYTGHELPNLFREGGNIHALAARARGTPTRLIGLTWIDELQVILVRPETGPIAPEQLKGMKIALPSQRDQHGDSSVRAMTLHGFKGALALGGLSLDDVQSIEVPLSVDRLDPSRLVERLWTGLDHLIEGKVDAVYVKGASAVDAAIRTGAIVGINLDVYPSRLTRVNNGTPRPITVHQDILDNHFDLVVKFLRTTLKAANWAADNLPSLKKILETETQASESAVETAYRNGFHRSLHPTLNEDRLGLLKLQANFLWVHGFLEHPVDVDAWVDARPLEAAGTDSL